MISTRKISNRFADAGLQPALAGLSQKQHLFFQEKRLLLFKKACKRRLQTGVSEVVPIVKIITLALLLAMSLAAFGKPRFEWTPALQDAYRKALSLRLDAAAADLATIRQNDPGNLLALHVENYVDFFRIYLNEDEAEFRRLEKNRNKRLEKIEAEGDPKSPYFLFLQADIRLQWALARLKFEEYSTAFFETNKAYKLLTKNAEKFPHFMPNKKDLGILHSITGTIPSGYKWAVDWLSSLEGTLEQGRAEMEEVVNYAKKNEFVYEEEVYVYYAYLLLHLGKEKEQDEAWDFLESVALSPAKNPLACFVKANVALRTGRSDEGIKILENKPTGKEFQPFLYLDYMLGVAKLQRLDKDADVPLLRYVENFKGKNFIKAAYQKLAWHCLLQNDRKGYDKFMNLCKSKGYTIVGSDKSAHESAKSGEVPVLELLKARLLSDGGRHQRAYDLLKTKKPSDFFAKKNQVEFAYRMGRITHELNRQAEALKFYQETIDLGKDESWYFACRAALERGHIFEEQGKKKEAKTAFELCLSMSPADHKAGLHQQAKTGLKRLK